MSRARLRCFATSARQPSPPRAMALVAGLPSRSWREPAKAGGAERDRTADLLIANEALSQLSYSPKGVFAPPPVARGDGI